MMRSGMCLGIAAMLVAGFSGCKNPGRPEKERHVSSEAASQPQEAPTHKEPPIDWSQTGTPIKMYSLVLDDVRYDPDHDVMGQFKFKHYYAEPIELFGFGFSDPKQFSTRFEYYRREESGQWADVPAWYCGTGAQTYPLKPDTEYVLLIPLSPFVEKGTRGQVGVPGKGIKVVSDPFQTDRIQQAWNSRVDSQRKQP
jgi:hypothetical protein